MNRKQIIIIFLCIVSFRQSAHAMDQKRPLLDERTCFVKGYRLLCKAADKGNLDDVKWLLDSGIKPNSDALRNAAYNGHKDVCALLIERNANVNEIDSQNRTALLWAAERRHIDICPLLLNANADANIADENGWTPLKIAVQHWRYDTCKLLLENKADVNDNKGDIIALRQAAFNSDKRFFELLLASGANVFAKDSHGKMSLCVFEPYAQLIGDKDVKICMDIFNAMCSKSICNKNSLIALLGIKRFGRSTRLQPIDKNVIRIIAQISMLKARQNKIKLEEAISQIQEKESRDRLSAIAKANISK